MRDFGIDVYLGDLNVAVDDLGGRVSLVGLCQGGWLAAAYAAVFRRKSPSWRWPARRSTSTPPQSDITPPPGLRSVGDHRQRRGARRRTRFRISVYCLISCGEPLAGSETAESALQCAADPAMMARFKAWNLRTMIFRALLSCRPRDRSFARPACARALHCARPAGRAVVNHSADFRPRRGGR